MADLLDFVPPILKGETEAQQRIGESFQEDGLLGGLASIPGQLPELAGETVGNALRWSLPGDLLDAAQGVAGRTLTGFKLTPTQRALSMLGIAGLGAAAVGARALHLHRQGILDLSSETGALRLLPESKFRPGRTVWSDTPSGGRYAGLSVPSRDPDFRWPGLRMETNRLLTSQSWDDAVDSIRHFGTSDVSKLAGARGLFQDFGRDLIEKVDEHRASVADMPSPEHAALSAAVWETSKIGAFVEAGKFTGPAGKEFGRLWNKLRTDGLLTAEEQARFRTFGTAFAKATSWAEDPELLLQPHLKWDSVDLGPDGVSFTLEDLGQDYVPLSELTPHEAITRFNRMTAKGNAEGLVPIFTENFLDALSKVSFRDIEEGLHWYEREFQNIVGEARKHGVPEDVLTAVVSAVSAAQNWERNVAIAAELVKLGRKNGGIRNLTAQQVQDSLGGGIGAVLTQGSINRAQDIIDAPSPEAFWGGKASDPNWWKALKQPSFYSNLRHATPPEAAPWLAKLFHWLPVTTDRHQLSMGLGFSVNVDGLPKPLERPGVYQALSDGMRRAAWEVGEVAGQPVSPAQLQGIIWSWWRRERGIVDDDYVALPGKARVTWKPGAGPDTIVNDQFLRTIQGERTPGSLHPAALVTDPEIQVPRDAIGQPLNGKAGESFRLTARPSGEWEVAASATDLSKEKLRGLYPTSHSTGHPGAAVRWAPAQPRVVDDVMAEKQRLLDSAEQTSGLPGGTGGRVYGASVPFQRLPSARPGRHILINALQPADGGPGIEAHKAFKALLREENVNFTEETLPPHVGYSAAFRRPDGELTWEPTTAERASLPRELVDEARVGLLLSFDSVDDMHRAWDVLRQQVKEGDRKLWTHGDTNELRTSAQKPKGAEWRPWTWADELYGEQILDRVAYTYGPHEAPIGTKRVYEHHFTDRFGNGLVHMNTLGDVSDPSNVFAHVEDDLYGYFSDDLGPRLLGEGSHTLVSQGPETLYSGLFRIPEHDVDLRLRSSDVLSARISKRPAGRALVWSPPDELPAIAYGKDAEEVLMAHYPVAPVDLVEVIRTGDKTEVHVPEVEGKVSLSTFERVRSSLRRAGVKGDIVMNVKETA